MIEIIKTTEYRNWLRDLKTQIKTGQIKATLSVNSQMIMMYWDLGRQISEKQESSKWGSGFIEQLSKDLKEEFPDMTGFSLRNLQIIKQWYLFYSRNNLSITKQIVSQLQLPENQQDTKAKQLVSQFISIPWGHHVKVLQSVKDVNEALFYINQTIENTWSRAVLEYQIETKLYERQGKAITNFKLTLPEPQSDLATAIMKDPYNFDFLQLSKKVKETDLEKALVQHISQFLPELGIGFAYMGRQFLLRVGDSDYRTDLLFYHTRLRCYVIIELKTKKFEPEFIGKLNFYITAVNELVKSDADKPTIGVLLCKNKDNYKVEFSLKSISNPIGVSSFGYTELPDDIKSVLPSAEELQDELLDFEQRMQGK